jgi:hypothetical protein
MTAQASTECTVCKRRLLDLREFGKRPYCDEHIAAFTQDIPSLWQASIFTFGLLVFLIAAVGIGGGVLGANPTGVAAVAVGVTLAVLPGLLWMGVLYRSSNRRHAHLSPLVPTLFVLGALLAAAFTRPVLYDLLKFSDWLSRTNASNRFLGTVLLAGFLHMFLMYALVRYSVWRTPVFTRRVDGVLYALAAHWGYASMLGALFVIERDAITLLNGGLRVIMQLPAYVAPGLVLGYFLGRNRFEDMPFYYLSSGLAMAAALNGLLLYAGTELNNVSLSFTQDAYSPWPGVVFNLLALILSYGAILGLLRRHNALTRARLETQK